MLDIRSILIRVKAACSLLICFAIAEVAVTGTRNVEATSNNGPKSTVQGSSAIGQTKGKVNGKIVFTSDRNKDPGFKLWSMNPDGSNPTQLTSESGRDPSLPSYMPVYDGPAKWSPDGSKIAFKAIRNGDYRTESYAIYVMDADAGNVQRIVIDSSSIHDASEIGSFEWSPDGTKYLFDAGVYVVLLDEFSKVHANLFTSSLDGKTVVQLTNDKNVFNGLASWSPDGKSIVFVSDPQDGSGSGGIQVMNADGSSRHTIGTGGSFPSWSPDGSKIVFVGGHQLYTINPDGSGLIQLTYFPPNYGGAYYGSAYSGPRYSPDGTKIVFERTLYDFTANIYEIFVINADGSNLINISNRLVTTPAVYDLDPDWQPLSVPSNDPSPSVLGFSDRLYLEPCSPLAEIVVTRTGNLNQTVSCDYQTKSGPYANPSGHLTFDPGETSKSIKASEFSWYCDVSVPTKFTLVNNSGNTTFVGGVKDATVVFVPSNANPIGNSTFFVRQHYRDFLGREPDSLGWDYWISTMTACGPATYAPCGNKRVDVSAAFFLSIEFQETGYLVYRIYKAAYGNLPGGPVPIKFNEFLPDTREIGHGVIVNEGNWEPQLEANKQAFFSEFVQRSRFTVAYPTFMTPVQFIDGLFANAGVIPSVSERESAIGEFNGATGSADNAARARALRRVAENATLQQQEFNRAFVLMQYFGYLRRDPSSGPDTNFDGYNFWLNKLNQFNGDYNKAEMVKAFISSGEYRQRFGP